MTPLFKIFRLDNDDVQKIATERNTPHQHDYEELIIGVAGKLEHFIDFQVTTFEAPFISYVTKGKVHRVVPQMLDGQCDMWVIRFQSEFIPETIFQLYAHYHEHANITTYPGDCFGRLVQLCEMINGEMQQATPDLAVVQQLLRTLFTMIESERRKVEPDTNNLFKTQNVTFKNFLRILEENYRRDVGVDFYAEQLFMSVRNLNLVCQSILQQSVFEIIETRKLLEAKNLLISTDKTIAEIGFDLGYSEKAYFTSVFKKKSGQTPSDFRATMRKLFSE